MPLNAVSRREVDYLQRTKGWGGRRIASALDLPYGQVRAYLESRQPDWTPFRAVVFDLETSSLRSDIGTLLVGSFMELSDREPTTRTIADFDGEYAADRERQLAEWVLGQWESADLLIGHNIAAFDKNFMRGVLFRHRIPVPRPKVMADTYLIARYGAKLLLQSYSLENVADVLGIGRKNHPPKLEWREANTLDPLALLGIKERCEADVTLNAGVWQELKQYWHEWRGQK